MSKSDIVTIAGTLWIHCSILSICLMTEGLSSFQLQKLQNQSLPMLKQGLMIQLKLRIIQVSTFLSKNRRRIRPMLLLLGVLENCEATDESHKALAYLCRELGHRNNAEYLTLEKDGALGTAASSEVANSLYKILLPSRNVMGYKPFNYTCFNNLILNMVSAKAVAHFRGSDYSTGGHAWVCEGGRHYEYHTACYFTNGEEDVRNTYYFYFNWGWNGDFNGYFLGDVYDPSQAISEEDLPPIPNDLLPFKPINRSGYSKDVYYYMIY